MLLGTVVGAQATAQAQICVSPPSGIVGWWPGNGSANDAIAGNNGQVAGNATFAAAVVGQGFKLDGFGDYVEIPDSAALKPAHMSVETWVRFDSLDTPIVSQFGAPGLRLIRSRGHLPKGGYDGHNGIKRLGAPGTAAVQ
jgi:hypothetical protein